MYIVNLRTRGIFSSEHYYVEEYLSSFPKSCGWFRELRYDKSNVSSKLFHFNISKTVMELAELTTYVLVVLNQYLN